MDVAFNFGINTFRRELISNFPLNKSQLVVECHQQHINSLQLIGFLCNNKINSTDVYKLKCPLNGAFFLFKHVDNH